MLEKISNTAKERKEEKEKKSLPPSAHPAVPGNQASPRTGWRSILTFRITKGMAPPNQGKQTNKKRRISPLSKMFGWQTTTASLPWASHMPRCKNSAPSELISLWIQFKGDMNSQLCSRLSRRRWGGRGDSGCFLVFEGQHVRALQSLTSSRKEHLSAYVIAVLTWVTHQHGISAKRQHKNHINVFLQRELAAWSLFATQIFCP